MNEANSGSPVHQRHRHWHPERDRPRVGYRNRRAYIAWTVHCDRVHPEHLRCCFGILAGVVSRCDSSKPHSSDQFISGLSFIDGGKSAFRWRFPIAFQIVFLLVLFFAVWFFPESPRWLVKVGREQEARYILQRLRGSSPEDRVRAEAEFLDIQSIAEMEKTVVHGGGNSYLSMLFGYKSGDLHIGRRVQLVVWLQIMQEWVGIAGVTVYAPTIFSIAGFDSVKSQWISGLNNVFYMVRSLDEWEVSCRLLMGCVCSSPRWSAFSPSTESVADGPCIGDRWSRALRCSWLEDSPVLPSMPRRVVTWAKHPPMAQQQHR